ncbi:MAG: hypothetical protein ACR2Q4_23630 [Geminicoccaceae bacterium]
MNATLMATPTRADAADRLATYKRVLKISIGLNILVGIFILCWPDKYTALLNMPDAFPSTWPRHWGAQLIAINLLYLPGLWSPIRHRYPNVLGIIIRLSFALFFVFQGNGFGWMALYDGLFGALLAWTYWRAWQADMMAKP